GQVGIGQHGGQQGDGVRSQPVAGVEDEDGRGGAGGQRRRHGLGPAGARRAAGHHRPTGRSQTGDVDRRLWLLVFAARRGDDGQGDLPSIGGLAENGADGGGQVRRRGGVGPVGHQ